MVPHVLNLPKRTLADQDTHFGTTIAAIQNSARADPAKQKQNYYGVIICS